MTGSHLWERLRGREAGALCAAAVVAVVAAAAAACGGDDDREEGGQVPDRPPPAVPEPTIRSVIVEPDRPLLPGEELAVFALVVPGSEDRPIGGGVIRRDGMDLALFEPVAPSTFTASVTWESLAEGSSGATDPSVDVPLDIEFVDQGGASVAELVVAPIACALPVEDLCDGVCIQTAADAENCGGCGQECMLEPQGDGYKAECVSGACAILTGTADRSPAQTCAAVCAARFYAGDPLACSATCSAEPNLDTTPGEIAGEAFYDTGGPSSERFVLGSCDETPPPTIPTDGGEATFSSQQCCCRAQF